MRLNSDTEENARLLEAEKEEGPVQDNAEVRWPKPGTDGQQLRGRESGSMEQTVAVDPEAAVPPPGEVATPTPVDPKSQSATEHVAADKVTDEAKAEATKTEGGKAEGTETEGTETEGKRPTESACILDGSKLILRIASPGKPFQVDHGLKIIMADGPLKRIERSLLHSTYVTEASDTTVVVDAGGPGLRFAPLLPSLLDGVVYTRDGCTHVVLSGTGAIQRSRVSAPNMPTRVVNKFVAQQHFRFHTETEATDTEEVFFPWSTLGHHSGQGGVIFVRCDDSIYSHRLKPRKLDLSEGRVIAWSAGITFQNNKGWFCFKRLSSAAGQGSVWIDNGKSMNNPNVVLT
ncbi:hypothetical protein GNI_003300 [Gregarina niphandrodes]|uniref:Uncharacterized protein n=1 Tax=Gregarina niphandrodes TaxID=110365 RepID=A0A023BDJ6_GRENI|nr:hypothetical protein GNI_003300 [Gregarina niphandrodes]EZG89037.1 hypothetical protein GNI_003300 [Gregarina niphandrodes]|eukprot:XP_011128506.1 hypothetical protein GNI_003300 [Gregarina niphandrodes]